MLLLWARISAKRLHFRLLSSFMLRHANGSQISSVIKNLGGRAPSSKWCGRPETSTQRRPKNRCFEG